MRAVAARANASGYGAAVARLGDIRDPAFLRVMAHPLRMRLLAMLEERPQSPVKLASTLEINLGLVSYHVKRLHEAGLIELVETHRRRGAVEHVYTSKHASLFSDEAWRELDRTSRAQLLFPILQQTAEYASRAARAGGFDRANAHFTRWSLKVDEEGWRELSESAADWVEKAIAIEARAAQRGADSFDAGLVVLLFEALPFSDPPAKTPSASGEAQRIESAQAWSALVESTDSFRGATLRHLGFESATEGDRGSRLSAHIEMPGSPASGLELEFKDVTEFNYVARGSGAAEAETQAELVFRFLSVEVRAASCEVTRV
jgi:DNA-binding transcriptional ArsR family regulator